MGSLWADADNMTAARRNRESIIGRLWMPIYDVDNSSVVTVTAVSVDGDDIITSETTHYTVPGSGVVMAVLQRITVCNSSLNPRACSIHLIESGGSRTVANRIYSAYVPAGSTVTIEGPFFLSASDTLRTIGLGMSANNIGLRAEVLEFAAQPTGVTLAHETTNGSGIEGAALTETSAIYYTAPAAKKTVAMNITVCNTDSSARTVTVYIVESGGVVAGAKQVIRQSVPAGASVMLDGPFVLDPGDTIRGLASLTAVVSIRITPVELD